MKRHKCFRLKKKFKQLMSVEFHRNSEKQLLAEDRWRLSSFCHWWLWPARRSQTARRPREQEVGKYLCSVLICISALFFCIIWGGIHPFQTFIIRKCLKKHQTGQPFETWYNQTWWFNMSHFSAEMITSLLLRKRGLDQRVMESK